MTWALLMKTNGDWEWGAVISHPKLMIRARNHNPGEPESLPKSRQVVSTEKVDR